MRLVNLFQLIFFLAALTTYNPYSLAKKLPKDISFYTAKEEDYCKTPTEKEISKEKTEAASPDTCIECLNMDKHKSPKVTAEKILASAKTQEQKINELLAIKEINPSWITDKEKQYTESHLKQLQGIKLDDPGAKNSAISRIHYQFQFICSSSQKNYFLDADCPLLKEKFDQIKEKKLNFYSFTAEEYEEKRPIVDEVKSYLIEYLEKKLQTLSSKKKGFEINNISEIELKNLGSDELQSLYERSLNLYSGSMPYSNKAIPCNLTSIEYFVLVAYAGDFYSRLNRDLREKSGKYIYTEKVLNSALDKFHDIDAGVKRGATLPIEILDKHKAGSILTYDGFTSTSIKKKLWGNTDFHIQSKRGKYIAHAVSSGEEEVLFKSKTKFKIISKEGNTIVMEEVD